MTDYIERNELIKNLKYFAPEHYSDLINELITKQPAADVAPVLHGRWVAVPSSDMMTGKAYKCSECNKMRYGSFMPNYCQNCGAKMDGENL